MRPANPIGLDQLTLWVADVPPAVTVTVSVTTDVAAPPPSLTQMMMTSLTVVLCSIRMSPPLELWLLFSDFSRPAAWASRPIAPRATKSACRMLANARGAAHNAVIAENLMLDILH